MATRGPIVQVLQFIHQKKNRYKYSVCFSETSAKEIKSQIIKKIKDAKIKVIADHLIIETALAPVKVLDMIKKFKNLSLVGYGNSIEIFKQVGNPKDVVKNFNLEKFSGTHAIGHTRMATESAITTDGSHPYSTGKDECLVHNGSLSNHNNLRRTLKKRGIEIRSQNDTEVAGGIYF